MNFEDLIYDVKMIYGTAKDDSRLEISMLEDLLNNSRAKYIRETFLSSVTIDRQWVQSIGVKYGTKVNSGDNSEVAETSINFAKYSLPKVVNLTLPHNESINPAIFRISMISGQERIYPTTMDLLVEMIRLNDIRTKVFKYFINAIESVYIWPCTILKAKFELILNNPLDAGIDIRNNYPLDASGARYVILDVLANELRMEYEMIKDIVNNAADDLRIAKSILNEKPR